VSRLFAAGWRPMHDLRSGLERTYEWFREHCEESALRTGRGVRPSAVDNCCAVVAL